MTETSVVPVVEAFVDRHLPHAGFHERQAAIEDLVKLVAAVVQREADEAAEWAWAECLKEVRYRLEQAAQAAPDRPRTIVDDLADACGAKRQFTCVQCGCTFEAGIRGRKYCTTDCRRDAVRQRRDAQ